MKLRRLLGLDHGTRYEQYPAGQLVRNRAELRARSAPGVTIVSCPCGSQFTYPGRSGGFSCPSCGGRYN